jgi:hypothetical protein
MRPSASAREPANSGHNRHNQEDDRLSRKKASEQVANASDGHVSRLRDSRHDRENDQAEDVVNDRRPEHNLGGGILKTTKITEDARSDTDASPS